MMIRIPRITGMGLPKFIGITSLLAELNQKPAEEIQADFAEDLEKAAKVRPQDASTMSASKKACFTTQVPNIAYIPPGTSILEVGVATASGFGKHTIDFDNTYSATPYALFTAFGFFEIKLPWGISTQWKKFDLRLFEVNVPVGLSIEWKSIRIPTLTFMTDITKEHVELFNVAGNSTVVYLAIGE